ncbi:hypothetical protein, partial [Sinimarinibacterium flocculans]
LQRTASTAGGITRQSITYKSGKAVSRSGSTSVLHKKWGVFRALVCTAAVFAVLILMSALNAAGK